VSFQDHNRRLFLCQNCREFELANYWGEGPQYTIRERVAATLLIDSLGSFFSAYPRRGARSGAPPCARGGIGFSKNGTKAVYIIFSTTWCREKKLRTPAPPGLLAGGRFFESQGHADFFRRRRVFLKPTKQNPLPRTPPICWSRSLIRKNPRDAMRIPVIEYYEFEADDVDRYALTEGGAQAVVWTPSPVIIYSGLEGDMRSG